MKKLNLLLLFLALVYGQCVFAQSPKGKGEITGTVVDASNNEPVPFATAALTNANSTTPIDGAVANESGKFIISKVAVGEYKVVISFLGYQDKVIEGVKLSDKKAQINLGTIKLSPTVQQLTEITIEAQKDLIEEKVDRTVYNAENDASNRGGDATDVLRKVPMLSVDLDGNVSLRGSQNLKVLINNRPSTIAASSVADALKQIPSDMIKSVEVITSPSSKYDAEGTGGIINIITKKNNLEGFSLNINSGVGTRGSNLGLNGSYRVGKMGFSLGGFGRAGYNIRGSFANRQLTNQYNEENILVESIYNTQQADTRSNNLFGRYQLGWDYDINKFNYISASVQYGARNMSSFQDNLLTQSFRGDNVTTALQDVDVSDLSGNVDANLNYTRTFNKPQQEFSILTQYSRNNRTNDFIRNSLDLEEYYITRSVKNLNESYNQETTIQLDYQTPIAKNQMLEIGGKNIMRRVTSNFKYFVAEGTDGEYIPQEASNLTNIFNYDQNVMAGYLSYTINLLKNYSIKAGSRYEYTTINARFQGEGDEIKIPSYGTLVPSVNISRKLKNGNMIKAAYNRRIQRPSLQFLNPNIQASNPLFETVGNPDLRPEFTNSYELGYNTYIKKTSLSLSAFMRNTTGSIQATRTPIGQVIRTTYENIGNEDTYGFNVSANVNISNKFTLNGGTDVYYAVLNNNVSDVLYNASNEGWVYNIRGMGSYNMAKGWGLQLFGFYRGRQVQLQGYQGGFGIYSLNLKKDFNEKKGSIGFGAENFFTTSIKMRNEVISPLINQSSTNVMRNMNFKINFSYRIGKMSMDNAPRRRKKSVSNDDLKEGGDNNGGGEQQGAPGGGQGPAGQPGGQRPAGQPGVQGQRPAGQGQYPGAAPAQKQYQQSDSTQTAPSQLPAGEQRQDSTQTSPSQERLQGQPAATPEQGQAPAKQQLPQDKAQPKEQQ